MSDELEKLNDKLQTPKKRLGGTTMSDIQRRVANKQLKQQEREAQSQTMPNRIAVMVDNSGSMCGNPIEMQKQAVEGFVDACNQNDTSLSLKSIPLGYCDSALTTHFDYIKSLIRQTNAEGGSTPMSETMEIVLTNEAVTRCVMISDGQPDSPDECFQIAVNYREAGIKIDCVHIGTDSQGESCLRRIAEITGGIYVKFDKIENFAKNFMYLTPQYRALLSNSVDAARLLGAREVK